MKKKYLFLISAFCLYLLGGLVWHNREAIGNSFNLRLEYLTGSSATTSLVYLVTTATTTYSFDSDRADTGWLQLNLKASSSGTALHWQYEGSNNNIDWFGEDSTYTLLNASTTIYHASSSLVHTWSASSTATTSRLVKLPDFGTRYFRVNFRPSGNNAAIWLSVTPKEQLD